MTDFIVPFDNFDAQFDIHDIYCPDVVCQRKASTHTLRRRNYITPTEYIVNIKRPRCDEGVPITEMDEYCSDKSVFMTPRVYGTYGSENDVSLGKKDMYEDFIFLIEELCSSKTVTYDKKTNMNKITYKVPMIGHIKNEYNKHFHSSVVQNLADDLNADKFIMIRHKKYSLDKYYREVGLDYAEVNIPKNYFEDVKLDAGEHYYSPDKTSCLKDNITFSFHHDVVISSLVIKPEKMSFKNVHGDNTYSQYDRRNPSLMRKPKYFIKVLENNPGFITKFELQYRSELTNGQWVKHGIYNANVSIADSVKISFDEIQVKEIRIIPISFHKSFDKIQLKFAGKIDVMPSSDEVFVIYELSIPRDGKYLTYSSKVHENNSWSNYEPLKRYRNGKQNRYNREIIRDCMNDY
jgi:hypothetical protein